MVPRMKQPSDRSGNPHVFATLLSALVLAEVGAPAALAADASCPDHMFIIERSTNANIVVYDANRGPGGEFDANEPVIVYWLMKAQQGQREELNLVERKEAYGIEVKPGKAPGTFDMALKADPKKAMTVALRKGCGVVLTPIGGQQAILRRLFVQSKEELIRPKVESIDFFGEDASTGAPVTEKYKP
jgi:hypothetical protein